MNTLSDESEFSGAVVSSQSSADSFDTRVHFDRWLQDLQAGRKKIVPEAQEAHEAKNSESNIGSLPDSNREVTFEGVLHFDSYSSGKVSSPEGTLVLTKQGRIEADIDVAVAVINGCVVGNITATERVVLEREALVSGQIKTRALSVRLGAVFDGDCLFTPTVDSVSLEASPQNKGSEELKHLAKGASA